jgi:cytochrome c5
MPPVAKWVKLKCLLWLALLAGVIGARAEALKTGSRGPFLHDIPLHDANGNLVSPQQAANGAPFSIEETCGKCHDYATISQGWHFNSAAGIVKPGRPGEPWILTDPATHTQIPLSYRGWAGTFKPAELGLSDYEFLTNFARHLPGGGIGDPDTIDPNDPKMAPMLASGNLEIDCLICHQSTGSYDHEDRFIALQGQHFRSAPTVASELGTLAATNGSGMTPFIKYNRAKFDPDDKVMFQVTRRIPPGNCYYCHTSQSAIGDMRWHSDRDVHLRAGLICVDCHRGGIDHQIVRGYEGEVKDRVVTDSAIDLRAKILQRDDSAISSDAARQLAKTQLDAELGMVDTLTCAGCHASGRLGSPRPIHKGMPPIHFAKLTCTACHSGPLPMAQPEIVQTSMAHALGLLAPVRGTNTAPIIIQPVFLNGPDGKIGPYKMVWPSYWARLKDGKLTPLLPAEAAKSIDLPKQTPEETVRDPYNTKPLTDAEIQHALESLGGNSGEPVFIAAGKMYRLDKGKLVAEENAAAAPYSWALAHDVRPAREALGAKGCADCHAKDSPAFLGTVLARGPVQPDNGVSKAMWQLRGEDKTWIEAFVFCFRFRIWLKCIGFGAVFVVLVVLVHYGLRGVGAITAAISSKKSRS